jgi:hypothetical protein
MFVPYDYSRLPKPDNFGNYWFGRPGDGNTPAILVVYGDKEHRGDYFVSLGAEGILFGENKKLRTFKRPEEALAVLREAMESEEVEI